MYRITEKLTANMLNKHTQYSPRIYTLGLKKGANTAVPLPSTSVHAAFHN